MLNDPYHLSNSDVIKALADGDVKSFGLCEGDSTATGKSRYFIKAYFKYAIGDAVFDSMNRSLTVLQKARKGNINLYLFQENQSYFWLEENLLKNSVKDEILKQYQDIDSKIDKILNSSIAPEPQQGSKVFEYKNNYKVELLEKLRKINGKLEKFGGGND